MIHTYNLKGMTCSSCEIKVKDALLSLNNIEIVEVSRETKTARIKINKHITLSNLQNALGSKYKISEKAKDEVFEQSKSWFTTYKPVLLIFFYILILTAIIEITTENLNLIRWMRHFMAGFFLTFSFFKFLNLKGFKENYLMYDIIAQKFPFWGYIYAFTEFFLGIAFLVNFNPVVTNSVTLSLMTISVIGVLRTILSNKTIKCACLGDVFSLPMSTVTIIEDGLMIVMSFIMLKLSIS